MASDIDLSRWLARRGARIDKATLGQLMILMELEAGTSVAAIGRGRGESRISTAVNYRQKLSRLERALGLGRLTYRDGSVTRPTETGRRVAQETLLFLSELRGISIPAVTPTWLIGSGEAWLHSVIVPAVVSLSSTVSGSRWEVKNLRARDIGEQLRAGKLHFGFLRIADAKSIGGIEGTGQSITLPGYRILASNAEKAPNEAASLIRWLIRSERPLVQQGTTWAPISEMLDKQMNLGRTLRRLEPQVLCETHVQAASAVPGSNAWCIVPAMLGRNLPDRIKSVPVSMRSYSDEAGLFVYPRALSRFAGADEARANLRKELGLRIAHYRC